MIFLEFEEFDLFCALFLVNGSLLFVSGLQRGDALLKRPYFVLVALLLVF